MSCDPANVSGLQLWLKGDDAATGTITTWADASGNGNDATAVGSPQGIAAELNGHKVVRFDASNEDYFTFADFCSGFTEGEIFIVVKVNNDPPGVSTSTGLWHLGGASNTHYPWTNGDVFEMFGTDTRKDSIAVTPSLASWRVYSVRSAPSDWEAYLDGASLFSTGTNTAAFPAAPKLGMSLLSYFLDGDLAELLLYNRSVTTTERGNNWHYLAEKYALTVANTVSCDAPASRLLKPNKLRPAIFSPGLGR